MRLRRLAPLLVAVALMATACDRGKAVRGDDGAVTKAGNVSIYDVEPGDCLDPGPKLDIEIGTTRAVPCAEPHTHEVFAVVTDKADKKADYPGEAELVKWAQAACLEHFTDYTGQDYTESGRYISQLYPSVKGWQDGDRKAVCVIVTAEKPTTGSARKKTSA